MITRAGAIQAFIPLSWKNPIFSLCPPYLNYGGLDE